MQKFKNLSLKNSVFKGDHLQGGLPDVLVTIKGPSKIKAILKI